MQLEKSKSLEYFISVCDCIWMTPGVVHKISNDLSCWCDELVNQMFQHSHIFFSNPAMLIVARRTWRISLKAGKRYFTDAECYSSELVYSSNEIFLFFFVFPSFVVLCGTALKL